MKHFNVKRISILPFGLVNAHIIYDDRQAILVDAGLPGTEKKILSALQAVGLTYQNIKLIIITHAHVDHAGNAARLRELSGAKILAHKADLPYYRREKTMTFCATGWFGRLFIKTQLMHQPYTAFMPDILLSGHNEFDLDNYGCSGRVIHTPGHTCGSLSVELDSQVALVGDLVASGILLGGIMLTNRPKQPPFEDNPSQVASALAALVDNGNKRFYMGHGGPLDTQQVSKHVTYLHQQAVKQQARTP